MDATNVCAQLDVFPSGYPCALEGQKVEKEEEKKKRCQRGVCARAGLRALQGSMEEESGSSAAPLGSS